MRFNQTKHNEEITLINFRRTTINFDTLHNSIETKNEKEKQRRTSQLNHK